jgi:hypothetical protein
MRLEVVPVVALAEQEARLHTHPVPRVCATQTSSLRAREEKQDLPKAREESWA